ncbi:hypothetical protein BD311DRAFT_25769 [Dichomitus squalens]|uniref:Uncharacterized protein n=1 Tax=Dichomitus squalens TaxID=114155 RepID=A0A4Q9MXY9_9APHY|nr:hypothetical protein BD311DRAFT_25769 [Dichomitus squalens]
MRRDVYATCLTTRQASRVRLNAFPIHVLGNSAFGCHFPVCGEDNEHAVGRGNRR